MKKVLLLALVMFGASPSHALINSIPAWRKTTVTYASLAASATTQHVVLFSLPAGGVIQGVKIKASTLFAGGGIATYTLSVGLTGNDAKYASAFDVKQAVGATVFQLSSDFFSENSDAAVNVMLTALSTGANLSAATSGSVDVWVLSSLTR